MKRVAKKVSTKKVLKKENGKSVIKNVPAPAPAEIYETMQQKDSELQNIVGTIEEKKETIKGLQSELKVLQKSLVSKIKQPVNQLNINFPSESPLT